MLRAWTAKPVALALARGLLALAVVGGGLYLAGRHDGASGEARGRAESTHRLSTDLQRDYRTNRDGAPPSSAPRAVKYKYLRDNADDRPH